MASPGWTGWTVAQTVAALADAGAVAVELPDAVGYVLPDDLEPAAEPEPWVALLPALDPTAMGWHERGWYLGHHRSPLFDRNGNVGPSVWTDGHIVGGWAQRKDGEVVVEILEDVGREARQGITHAAEHLRAWLGDTRITPRFPTPLHQQLVRGQRRHG